MESTNPNENKAEEMSSEATKEDISSEGEQQAQAEQVHEANHSSTEDPNQDVGDLFDTDDDDFIKSLEDEQKKTESSLAEQQEVNKEEGNVDPDPTHTEEPAMEQNLSEETPDYNDQPNQAGVIHHEANTPLSEIPVTVNVELARINCNLQDLMDLNEESVLELQGMSEQTLDLMVGDRCIGKAELLKIGDKMGIRILQITK